jgi:outer membrane receptor protein involved in Fe transport
MIPRVASIVLALLVVCRAQASAQPPAQGQQAPPISDQVFVTANRLQERIANIPVEVEIITADDIRRSGARTLDEVLKKIPGFSLLRQANSLNTSPSTRATSLRGLGGSSSSRTLVLVDGVPINSSVTGAVFWPAISLESIERVEIVKSPSGVWGNLALGGVISIVTKSARRGETDAGGSIEGGTHGSGQLQAGMRRFIGPVGVSAFASYLRTDGFVTVRSDRAGPIDQGVSDRIETVSAKVESRDQRRAWSVGGSFYKEHQLQGTPLQLNDVDMGTLHASAEFGMAGGSRLQLVGFVRRQTVTIFNTSIASDRLSETPSSRQDPVPGNAVGGSVQWSRLIARRHLVSAGADVEWTSGNLFERFTYSAAVKDFTRLRDEGGQQMFAGGFIEDLVELTPRWRLNAALRVDGWKTRAAYRRETELATGAVLRDDIYPDVGVTAVDPSLGTVVRLSNRVSVRAAINRAFRAPFPNELYHPFRSRGAINEANPALTPEHLIGAEAGLDLTPGPSLALHVTGFDSRLDDPVINGTIGSAGATSKTIEPCGLVSAFNACRQLTNAGRLSSRGIDVTLDVRPAPVLELSVSYTFNNSRIVEAPGQPQLVGKRNRQSPVHQGVFALTYTSARVATARLVIRLVGQRFEDDINTTSIAPFRSIDLNVTRQLSTASAVYVTLQNLADRVNELTHSDDGTYSIVGPRQVNAGLRLRF